MNRVSISQSRCFSCQVGELNDAASKLAEFQSRNRDAFHFRHTAVPCESLHLKCFNLVIEMLFISGKTRPVSLRTSLWRFNLVIEMLVISGNASRLRSSTRTRLVSISQSRGLSFQVVYRGKTNARFFCFNLVIEMLFISG